LNIEGNVIGKNDMPAQTEQAYENLKRILSIKLIDLTSVDKKRRPRIKGVYLRFVRDMSAPSRQVRRNAGLCRRKHFGDRVADGNLTRQTYYSVATYGVGRNPSPCFRPDQSMPIGYRPGPKRTACPGKLHTYPLCCRHMPRCVYALDTGIRDRGKRRVECRSPHISDRREGAFLWDPPSNA